MTEQLYDVSVVIAAHKFCSNVSKTIDSVLSQQNVNIELIIVIDGGDDRLTQFLDKYTKHQNVHTIFQTHSGLTKALIRGCKTAKYDFIARIDVGDFMLPGRLFNQAKYLTENSDVVLVSSLVDVVSDEGFYLYSIHKSDKKLMEGLTTFEVDKVISTVHSAVMFRKTDYNRVGGYRKEFYFAQDLDLWSRLIEMGKCHVIQVVLTKTTFSATGISGLYRDQQMSLVSNIVKLKLLRSQNLSEEQELLKVAEIKPEKNNPKEHDIFGANYFIASCLLRNKSKNARIYLYRALLSRPWSIKAWGKLLYSCFIATKTT